MVGFGHESIVVSRIVDGIDDAVRSGVGEVPLGADALLFRALVGQFSVLFGVDAVFGFIAGNGKK